MAPSRRVKVAGVTFEGRQDAVKLLHPGQPLMLRRTPWNKFDRLAVEVTTLSGEPLGYVPKTENANFQTHEVQFGRVEFVGRVPGKEPPTWGLALSCWPDLASPDSSPLPWELLPAPKNGVAGARASGGGRGAARGGGRGGRAVAGAARGGAAQAGAPGAWQEALQAAVGAQRWAALAESAHARAYDACEVTGLPLAAAPLQLVPVWRFDEGARTAKLLRLALVCPEVALCARALDLPPGSEEERTAASAIVAIHRWEEPAEGDDDALWSAPAPVTNPHLTAHLAYVRGRRDAMRGEGWGVDLTSALELEA
ncbi:hypothetical protein FOA52_011369 [Chlamydomonas sp. UWO 241]|nr:hypothetical protein FOA52_011369 [Chlamydomonas sp. UWO 241]